MSGFSFSEPLWLLGLGLLLPLWWHHFRVTPMIFSQSQVFQQKSSLSLRILGSYFGVIFRSLVILFLVLALARPQLGRSESTRKTEGLDIMLVVDASGSMQAMDFKVEGHRRDRLSVVKSVLSEFIPKRRDDRMGMVVFGTQAYVQAPLTLDHDVLGVYLDSLEIGMAGEATAIGDAMGMAMRGLKDAKGKSKIMILLTDGSNTAGKIEPLEAAQAASALGIKVYTIGVGSNGLVPIRTSFGFQQVQLDLDETALKKIATKTNGQYFRATDTDKLLEIYDTIDQLEKTEIELKVYYHYEEQFAIFVWLSLFFFLAEGLFSLTKLKRIP